MHLNLRLVFVLVIAASSFSCQSSSSQGKGIADSCYQPLYWPSKACPPGKK